MDSTQSRIDTLVEKKQYIQHRNIDHHEDPLEAESLLKVPLHACHI